MPYTPKNSTVSVIYFTTLMDIQNVFPEPKGRIVVKQYSQWTVGVKF